jgi:hypothetical protein
MLVWGVLSRVDLSALHPAGHVGEANADIMRGCFGRVAAATGGILGPMALQL